MLCKIKSFNLILPKPLVKWLVEALFSVSTNYNHYNTKTSKPQYLFTLSEERKSKIPPTYVNGIVAYFKLKKLPEEDPTNQENGEFSEESDPQNTPVLRMADLDAKCKVLLETEKDGFAITYRRVKKVNELVINNIVYDEYEAIIESPHTLCAVVSNRTIEAGYDGARSYIKVDGKIIAKKLRLI